MGEVFKSWQIRMPWTEFDPTNTKSISGSNGVYEVADEQGGVIYVGYAGGKDLFGIRGKIMQHFSSDEPNPVIRARARRYHYEVTSMWLSRWVEILGRHREDLGGRLPEGNETSDEPIPRLPKFTGALWYEWNRRGTPAERERRAGSGSA
ncbi:MAG TPA: hypothetical protein VJO34_07675 [Methylomirabilota bacterium]|nr:hypothetical protein [Methylomirabilota bacterium]